MLVRVPASKLGEFDPSATTPTPASDAMAEQIVRDLYRRHGKTVPDTFPDKSSSSVPDAPASAPEPVAEPVFDLDAFLDDCKNDLI